MNHEKDFNIIFSENLNYYMTKTETSRGDLAKLLDVSVTSVANWCKGLKTPRMDKVDRMCRFFNVQRSDLIQEKATRDPVGPPTTVTSASESDIQSLFIDEYGQEVFDHAMKYNRLDDRDQGKADGFVSSLLEDAKYKGAESSNAKAI